MPIVSLELKNHHFQPLFRKLEPDFLIHFMVDNEKRIKIKDKDELAKHFLIATDDNTYFFADIKALSDEEANHSSITFKTDQGKKTLIDIKKMAVPPQDIPKNKDLVNQLELLAIVCSHPEQLFEETSFKIPTLEEALKQFDLVVGLPIEPANDFEQDHDLIPNRAHYVFVVNPFNSREHEN